MDGISNPVLLAATLLVLILVSFIILFIFLYNKAQLKFQLERQQFQQALLQTEIEIRELTLINVSRELHDNLGQVASLLKMTINQIDDPIIQESNVLVNQLISDIKSISTSLKGNQLSELGLEGAIEQDVQRINKLTLIQLQFSNALGQVEVPSSSSIFMYRMYQEIINNILSHSQATEAQIHLKHLDNELLLEASDNGIGFSNLKQNGNGLNNLEERCKILGAQLNIDSSPNKGTKIQINLPLT